MIPNSDYYDRHYNRSWNGLTTISNSIGQGEVTLTPLQIANLGATIANRGYYITPHVVRQIDGQELDSAYVTPHYVNVSRQNYEIVVHGMRQSVIEGTCRSAASRDYLVQMAFRSRSIFRTAPGERTPGARERKPAFISLRTHRQHLSGDRESHVVGWRDGSPCHRKLSPQG